MPRDSLGLTGDAQREALAARHRCGHRHLGHRHVITVNTHYGLPLAVHTHHQRDGHVGRLIEDDPQHLGDKLHCCEIIIMEYHLILPWFLYLDSRAGSRTGTGSLLILVRHNFY